MRRAFRSLFLLLTALGYGFLGGGPSLWALGLGPAKAEAGAACAMHLCKMKHKPGEVCLCLLRPELMKASQGECSVRAQGCGHDQADGADSLAPLRPHLRPQAWSLPLAEREAAAVPPSSAFFSEFVPSPLERPPRV